MHSSKRLVGALALTVGMVASARLFAAPVACLGSGSSTSDQPWSYFIGLSAEGCYQQDKRYSGFSITSGSAPATLQGKISYYNDGDKDYHSVNWSSSGVSLSTTFTLRYTVTIYNRSEGVV